MKMRFILVTFCILTLLTSPLHLIADEGIWLPFLIKQLNEKDMKKMGMKMSADDIYSVNKGSLKDAIIWFNGGCTGGLISEDGLLITNHHCGYSYNQSLSTPEKNLLKDGFWAKNRNEELPCPGLWIACIQRIYDVTEDILKQCEPNMEESHRQDIINKNIEQTKKNSKLAKNEIINIVPIYDGTQFIAVVTVHYRDVRLVGTPPDAIGKFGEDTDNWVWPRHTGDFSLFRVYAGPDNAPVEYHPDNKPYHPKRHLHISMKGVKEGDFSMVMGFPGRTQEYLPSKGVDVIQNTINPARVEVRTKALRILREKMQSNELTRLKYAAKYARLANAWKKWDGEMLGLRKTNALNKKRKLETEFQARVVRNPQLESKYGTVSEEYNKLYQSMEQYMLSNELYQECFNRIPECHAVAQQLNQLVDVGLSKGEAAYQEEVKNILKGLPTFYKNLDADLEKQVCSAVYEVYDARLQSSLRCPAFDSLKSTAGGNVATAFRNMFDRSVVASMDGLMQLLNGDMLTALTKLREDPLCQFLRRMKAEHAQRTADRLGDLNKRLAPVQRKYIQALKTVFPEKKFYPDANSTLRVTYGKVEGLKPRNGICYESQTTFTGVMEKYIPGDYEFDLPKKLIELYERKDFGQYAVNGDVPVAYIGSNHTSGGNSGSPALNAYGELVGLNFDRIWEGTMSDVNYDVSLCRNIMVDVRYILFITDKFGGAGYLLKELNIKR